jgi:hypothetical protein
MQQQLSMPPAIMVQRFCSIDAETVSSQEHVTFMPPVHFATVMVQRGTIIMPIPGVEDACGPIIPVAPGIGIPGIGIPDIGMPGIAAFERSIIFTLAIIVSFIP